MRVGGAKLRDGAAAVLPELERAFDAGACLRGADVRVLREGVQIYV